MALGLAAHESGAWGETRLPRSERASVIDSVHLVDTPRGKKQELVLPPSQNLLRAGHVPVECISFQARTMAAAASRAPSQLSRRDALNLTASAPRLSDLLSKSRSGDTADQQVACVCTPCSAAWSAVAISSCPGSPTVMPTWCVGAESTGIAPETQDFWPRC